MTVLLIPLRFLGIESFWTNKQYSLTGAKETTRNERPLLLHIGVWAERSIKTNFIRISYEDMKFLSAPAQKFSVLFCYLLFDFKSEEIILIR
jgi:hypothetical protein